MQPCKHRSDSRSPSAKALEAVATGMAGVALVGGFGFVLGVLPAIPFGLAGGLNGFISGARGIYDWRTRKGWLAFVADSTWGILGTSTSVVLHALNSLRTSCYSSRLSFRRNRHIYEGGFGLKSNLALTQGNVISNAGQGRGEIVESFLDNHEELHIWQQRFFGPFFQLIYFVWFPLGTLVGLAVWVRNRDESLARLVETASYYNNPFEYWAYRNDRFWPPSRAHPKVRWGNAPDAVRPQESSDRDER